MEGQETPVPAKAGELVIRDDSGRPVVSAFPGQPNAEAERAALIRAEAVEITGVADPELAIASLYPKFGDSELRKKALHRYIADSVPLETVAKELGVEPRVVFLWAYSGRWSAVVNHEITARRDAERVELNRIRIAHRAAAMAAQLDNSKEIREIALEKAREAETAGQVKMAADAFKSAADVESRALGMGESGAVEDDDPQKQDKEKDGKKPLVVIVNNNGNPAGLPDVRKAQ